MENETITPKETMLLDYLFGEFNRSLELAEDYQEMGEIFDEDE